MLKRNILNLHINLFNYTPLSLIWIDITYIVVVVRLRTFQQQCLKYCQKSKQSNIHWTHELDAREIVRRISFIIKSERCASFYSHEWSQDWSRDADPCCTRALRDQLHWGIRRSSISRIFLTMFASSDSLEPSAVTYALLSSPLRLGRR